MPLNEDQKFEIEEIFLNFNTDDTGALSFDEFYKFLEYAWSNESIIQTTWTFNLNRSIAKFIFDGISDKNSTSVLFSETITLIEAILDKNEDFLIHFVYKAMDSKRSNNIPIDVIPKSAQLFGFDNCEKKIYTKISKQFGENKKNLTYQEFYQLLTQPSKEEITLPQEKANPEENNEKSVSKSACCLLI